MEAHDFQTWVMQTYDSKYVEKWEKFLFFSDCGPSQYPCDGGSICLTAYDFCDNFEDCEDGYDEDDC